MFFFLGTNIYEIRYWNSDWSHQRNPIANLVGWRDKPVALSIVQARLVGLTHFTVGNFVTFGAFVIASTSGKFG